MASSDALISVPVSGGSPAALLMKDVSTAQDKTKLAHAHAPIDKNGAHVNPSSEETLALVKTAVDQFKALGATEVTLAAVKTAVQAGATLVGQNAIYDALVIIENTLTGRASDTTVAAVKTATDSVKTAVDQAKAAGASETTLAAVRDLLSAPIATVGKSAHVTSIPTPVAGTYGAGKVIGGVFTLAGIFRAVGKSASLQSASLRLKVANTSAIDLVIFREPPTVTGGLGDGSNFSVDAADFDKVSKVVSFSVWNSLGTPSMSNVDNIGKLLGTSAGVDLKAVLVARGSVVISSASDISVGAGVFQD